MARAYLELFIVRSEPVKEKIIENWMNEFSVDGIIFHDAKTCPYNTNSRYGMPQRLQENTGKPYLIINGDLNDMRLFSDEQTRTNVEAFVEQILDSK
jgi:benzoyl-CoA reductase/2-hydroxyglutaryl-CoA dehydratase subunit BcrC/BadD/HgdB